MGTIVYRATKAQAVQDALRSIASHATLLAHKVLGSRLWYVAAHRSESLSELAGSKWIGLTLIDCRNGEADVAVLICGQELQIHRIERNETMITQLIALERQFWQHVERDQAPPADGSDSADVALRALYPNDAGQTVDFSQDLEMAQAFWSLLGVRQVIAGKLALESQFKQQIQQRMGDASRAVFETGQVSWKRSKDSKVVDVEKLLADHPALKEAYAATKPGSRRFLIKDNAAEGEA